MTLFVNKKRSAMLDHGYHTITVKSRSDPVAARRIATWSTAPVEKKKGGKKKKEEFLLVF